MGRPSIFEKDVLMIYVYDELDNCTQYMRCQMDKMLKDLKITRKSLTEYISRGGSLPKNTIYKLNTNEDMVKII